MSNDNPLPVEGVVFLVMEVFLVAFCIVLCSLCTCFPDARDWLNNIWDALLNWQKAVLCFILLGLLGGGVVGCFIFLEQTDPSSSPTSSPTPAPIVNKPAFSPSTTTPSSNPTTEVGRRDSTLSAIIEREMLHCGITPQLGYATNNSDGQWEGFEVDLCRAVAAGIFGEDRFQDDRNAEPVRFVEVDAMNRFIKLDNKEIDLLLGITSQTLERTVNEVSHDSGKDMLGFDAGFLYANVFSSFTL